jgi:acyl-coenzyme A thioesterase PaaI-like protein
VHGGWAASVLDTAMALAAMSSLDVKLVSGTIFGGAGSPVLTAEIRT